MVNIAIIGCGYWGPNYIRIFNELEEGKVKYCCDLEENNLSRIKKIILILSWLKTIKRLLTIQILMQSLLQPH